MRNVCESCRQRRFIVITKLTDGDVVALCQPCFDDAKAAGFVAEPEVAA